MKFQLIIWLLFPIINLELVASCTDYIFRCPWDADTYKIYTDWSWKKWRCVMGTTQNVNQRMKDKCDNLGTCDNSTTWYENHNFDCSVPAKYVKEDIKVGRFTLPPGGKLTDIDEFMVMFKDACVMHDICYKSGETKLLCDGEFAWNLNSMCAYVHGSPQSRYKKVGLASFAICPFYATGFALAVTFGDRAWDAWETGNTWHHDHCRSRSDVPPIQPLTDEEKKVEFKTLNELMDQEKRDLESYNKNNYNPNNELDTVLNDMEWKMNILMAFVGGVVVLLCCIIFYQHRMCSKEKSIKYSKVASYNADSDADVLVNVK